MIYIAWPFLVEHGFLFREGRQTYGLFFLASLCRLFLSFPILVIFGERFSSKFTVLAEQEVDDDPFVESYL